MCKHCTCGEDRRSNSIATPELRKFLQDVGTAAFWGSVSAVITFFVLSAVA